jgi:predicted metal-binding membrane protein
MVPPSHQAGILSTTATWMAMMTVMMLPVITPWLLGFAALSRDREAGTIRPAWVALFALGYAAAWTGFSVLAASLQLGIQGWGLMETPMGGGATAGGPLALTPAAATRWASVFHASPALGAPLGGLILIGTGLYQVAPAKAACLEHCRTPLSYFLTHWQNGPGGAFKMGLSHGAFCVGCCWALMLSGFALGLMSLIWMVGFTAIIGIETLTPHGKRIGRLAGVGMVLWGLTLLTGF